MHKVIIYLAGQSMFTEATSEELESFRRMISRSAYVSWSISTVTDETYRQELIDREQRVSDSVKNIKAIIKRNKPVRKWYQF